MELDIQKIRNDFPVLSRTVYDKPLVYFDNGATTQKPRVVIDLVTGLYSQENSSIHRGVHFLSEQMTELYENARKTVQEFINARYSHEIVFTSGTTGSINAIAFSFGERFVGEGDEILVSGLEHHSNLVPWQMLCERKKAVLKIIPFTPSGELILDEYRKLLTSKTRLVAVNHVSNSLGTVNPVKEMIALAHQAGACFLVDGAQGVQHQVVDVQDLECDFYVFSGHKIYGPTGTGILYGRESLLEAIPPYQGGGDMVDTVTYEKTVFNSLPFKFEAGTSNYIGAAGMAAAIGYLQELGIDRIAAREDELLQYATAKLSGIEGLRIYGTAPKKAPIISFLVGNIHPYDMGMLLDKMGIAVRTGTHCTMPVMDYYGIDGTVRASLAFYNTTQEIDVLYDGILKARGMLG